MTTQSEAVYTVAEVSTMLRMSPYSIREMLKLGTMKGMKVGTKWRIPQSSITEMENQKEDEDATNSENPSQNFC